MSSLHNVYISQAQKFYLEYNDLPNVWSSFQSFKLLKNKFAEWFVFYLPQFNPREKKD